MAEPFVFHFRRGEGGAPEQMYLADIRAECGLCRHVQVQRYYHSTPVHPVTIATLTRLATSVAQKTTFECPNCGSEVGPEHALSTAFTWAFPDDTGLIRGFMPDAADPTSLRWQFAPHWRLDPQELPGWEPVEGEPTLAMLDDEVVEEALGRVVNVKSAIREALCDWLDDPTGGAIATVAPDMTLIAAGPDATLDELAAELDPAGVGIGLDDAVPTDLPTHREPAEISGCLDGWLPAGVNRADVRVYVKPDAAFEVLERAFDVANLTRQRDEAGYTDITTPRDATYPRPLPILAVLRRAVYTGLTPGDAARLTAEEIVGTLLRVW